MDMHEVTNQEIGIYISSDLDTVVISAGEGGKGKKSHKATLFRIVLDPEGALDMILSLISAWKEAGEFSESMFPGSGAQISESAIEKIMKERGKSA
jgi:hypothetical protein